MRKVCWPYLIIFLTATLLLLPGGAGAVQVTDLGGTVSSFELLFDNGWKARLEKTSQEVLSLTQVITPGGMPLMAWPTTEARWQLGTSLGRPSSFTGYAVDGDAATFIMRGGTADKPLFFRLVLRGESLSLGDRSVTGISRRYIIDTNGEYLEYANLESYFRPGSSLSGSSLLSPNFLSTPGGLLVSLPDTKWQGKGNFDGLPSPAFRGRNWAGESIWYGIGENRAGEYYLSWTRIDTGYRRGEIILPAQMLFFDDAPGADWEKCKQIEDAFRARWSAQLKLSRQHLGDAMQIDIQGTLYNGSKQTGNLFALADRYLKPQLPGGGANPDYIGSYGYRIVFIEPWLYYNNRSCHPLLYEIPPWIGGEDGLRYFTETAHAAGLKVMAWIAPAGIYGYSPLRVFDDWKVKKRDGSSDRTHWFGRDAYSLARGYPSSPLPRAGSVSWGTAPLPSPTGAGVQASQAARGFSGATTLSYRITTSGTRGDSTPLPAAITLPAGGPYAVNLSWNRVPGAAGYRIFRLDPASGRHYLLAELYGEGNTLYTDDGSAALERGYEPLDFNNAYNDGVSGNWSGFYDYLADRLKYFAFKDNVGNIHGIDGYYYDSNLVMNEGNNDDWYYRWRDAAMPVALTEPFYWALAVELQQYGLLYAQEVDPGVGPVWEHNPSEAAADQDFYAHYGQLKVPGSNPLWCDPIQASRRREMDAFVARYGMPQSIKVIPSGSGAGIYWFCYDNIWRRYPDGRTIGEAAMQIEKKVDKSTALPGDVLTYSLTYRNAGPGAALGVLLEDALPEGIDYLAGSGGAAVWDAGARSLKWSLDRVEEGSGGMITFKAVVK